MLKQILDASARIPEAQRRLLSSGGQNLLHLADYLNRMPATAAPSIRTPAPSPVTAALDPNDSCSRDGLARVSDPKFDFQGSVFGGFTQSESSSAWCGQSVVVGYNDTSAYMRTVAINPGAAGSNNGVSFSVDGGRTFTDLGDLNPGTDPANFLLGDPILGCASPSVFYYASIFQTATPPDPTGARNPLSAISLSISSDGGKTWGSPNAAAAKDALTHFLDKPWMAVDPTNPSRIYVTYTDFDITFSSPACGFDFRLAIEMVSSSDGGSTWSAPSVVDEECVQATGNSVQGSNIAVSGKGTVHVAWEFFPGAAPRPEIHVASSADGGATFGRAVAIASVTPNGGGGHLQGGFRNNEFPQIAIDRSPGPSAGMIYVTWSDGRTVVPDLLAFGGTYAYPDVVLSKSTDGGSTWSAPAAVSPVSSEFTGPGRDQFMPGIAIDRRGNVAVCFYDRSARPTNLVIDRYCARSPDGGATWNRDRVSSANWVPMHASDTLLDPAYMGDYDALTTDFTLQSDGFFGAFQVQHDGNPDVLGKRF